MCSQLMEEKGPDEGCIPSTDPGCVRVSSRKVSGSTGKFLVALRTCISMSMEHICH